MAFVPNIPIPSENQNIEYISGDPDSNRLLNQIFDKITKITKFQDDFDKNKELIITQLTTILGKVNQMKSEIQTLEAKITQLQSKTNPNTVENMSEIAELQTQIKQYKEAIEKINTGLDAINMKDLSFTEIQDKVAELDRLFPTLPTAESATATQPVTVGGYLYGPSRKRYSKKSKKTQRPSTNSSKKFKGGRSYPYRKKRNKSKKQLYRRKAKRSKRRHYK